MKIIVGQGSCGIAAGANKIVDSFANKILSEGLNIELEKTGCIGMCYLEPIVEVIDDQGDKITYVKVTSDKVSEILKQATTSDEPRVDYTMEEVDQRYSKNKKE